MNQFDIFIAYISWGSDGKNRPVLVLLTNDNNIYVYPITTQYENKSESIREQYFKINDWIQSGLSKQSYVDTGTLIKLPVSVLKNKTPIGRLSIADKQKLLEFLTR